MNKKEENVRKWYAKEFPREKDFAKDIDKKLTFEEIYKCFTEEKKWTQRVDETLNKFASDSDVRNRILEETNNRYNMGKDEIYDSYCKLVDDYIFNTNFEEEE